MRDGWRAGRGRTDAARAPVGPVSFQRGGTSEDDQALPAALGGDACQGVPAARSRIVAPRVDVELSTPQPGRRGRHPRRSPSDETEGAGFLSFPTRCPREQARLRVGSGRQLPRERSVLSPANQAVRMLKKSPAGELISANPPSDLSTFPVSSRWLTRVRFASSESTEPPQGSDDRRASVGRVCRHGGGRHRRPALRGAAEQV